MALVTILPDALPTSPGGVATRIPRPIEYRFNAISVCRVACGPYLGRHGQVLAKH
jgi:hypothetical protein